MREIETGYGIGGRTWISDRWDSGSLTREAIANAVAKCEDVSTEEVIRAQLLESEAEHARELFEEDGNTKPYEALLNECVERELEAALREQADMGRVASALVDLYDNWIDDMDDERQFELVYEAHCALDNYSRALDYGEYHW